MYIVCNRLSPSLVYPFNSTPSPLAVFIVISIFVSGTLLLLEPQQTMAISGLSQFSHTYDPSLGAQLGRVGVADLFGGGQENHTISAKYQLENRRCHRQQKACNDARPRPVSSPSPGQTHSQIHWAGGIKTNKSKI